MTAALPPLTQARIRFPLSLFPIEVAGRGGAWRFRCKACAWTARPRLAEERAGGDRLRHVATFHPEAL